ncbi:MAG: phospholipase D-like domain-containing protein [Acidobacteriota bacterium]
MGWMTLVLLWAGSAGQLVLDREYLPKAAELIGAARKSVVVCMFMWTEGEGVGEIERCLGAAVKRGVAVEVLLEQSDDRNDEVTEGNRKAASRLRSHGVQVAFDCPDRRTHIKAIIVDSRTILLGSHNLTYSALRNNNEVSVAIESPEMAVKLENRIRELREDVCSKQEQSRSR